MKPFAVFVTAIINILCLSLHRDRVFSVAGIFNIMWGICLGFSCFGFLKIDTPSWLVVSISCISMFVFTLGSTVNLKRIKPIKIQGLTFKQCGAYYDRQSHTGMIVLHIIAYIFSLPYFRSVLQILRTGNLYLIRTNAFEGNATYTSTASLTIFQNVIAPLFVATLIMALIDAANSSLKKSTLVFAVTDILLYTLLFAGRYMVFQTLILAVFIFYDFSRLQSVFKFIFRHKRMVVFCIILVGILFFISTSRSSMRFIESLFIYFCGSFSYLTKLLDNGVGIDLHLHGKTQFGFIYNTWCMIVTYVFGLPYKGSNFAITQLTQETISIGGGYRYNSLGTFLHDFMADYGIWGSLFGVFVFSIMCHYVETVKRYYNDYFHSSVYYYILFVVANTVLGYSLRSSSFLFLLIFCWIFSVQKECNICQDSV